MIKTNDLRILESMDVYDRVGYKCKNGINELDFEEREFLIKSLEDKYSVYVFRMSDEHLLAESNEQGVC